MSQDPVLRQLLAPMAEQEVDLEGAPFQVDRERVLSRMAQANASAHSERRRWLPYAALAAAGIAVLVLGARFLAPNGGPEVEIAAGTATQAHGELETAANSSARVRTADGMQIDVQSQTHVAMSDLQANSRLKLLGGSIRCTIPHRNAARAFQVSTPDVTIVDLGTVFTVSIEGPQRSTRVSVEEGDVMVQRGSERIVVRAPGTWSSAPPVAARPSAEPSPAEPAATSVADLPLEPAPVKLPLGKAPPATLAHEAQLLRQGLAAERQGHAADAISMLTQLIKNYPNSPLIPDARAALARVQAGTR